MSKQRIATIQESKKNLDDRELMDAIAHGDTEELGQLYQRHQERVLALARRILGQWNLAEDVSQETFLRVQRAAKDYRPQAEFTTWLYRIVVNLCLDEKRKQKRQAAEALKIRETTLTMTENSAKLDETNEQIGQVWKALDTLNQRQRTAVILHKIEGLSHTEISKRTGWSQSSIESLLVRAYRKLRRELTMQK